MILDLPSSYEPFKALPPGAHILTAFSGGVDSAVTALLALQHGYHVTAIRMVLFPEDNHEVAERAEKTAALLGIPLHTVSVSEQFRKCVLYPCWQQFKSGITPNPCAMCNPQIKFGLLMPFLKVFNCDAFATGHYAKIYSIGKESILARGSFRPKDQSYFLSGLSREQLSKTIFPLGDMSKEDVKAIALSMNLPCSKAKESQDACFMPPNQTAAGFLKDFFKDIPTPGVFRSFPDGRILGTHSGIWNYTIGQRKGTGIALGVPAWINHIEQNGKDVWITTHEKDLFSSKCTTASVNWIIEPENRDINAQVQIRYRSKPINAQIRIQENNTATITFSSPVRAITPGQIAVLYQDDIVLGGAKILQSF